MCCEATEVLDLPPAVIEAQARYRRLLAERGWDWGDERPPDFFRWARFSQLGPVLEAVGPSGDWAAAIRSVVGDDVPAGIVLVRVGHDRGLHVDIGPARLAIEGSTVSVDVVVDSAVDTDIVLRVADQDVAVPASGAAIETVDIDGAEPVFAVSLDGVSVVVEGAVRRAPTAHLLLSSPRCSRWSVTDAGGGAWFPDGVPAKWDVAHRPFFHGREVLLAVPAGPVRVGCARGLEFDRTRTEVAAVAGETLRVETDPQRLFDPAADGWYGGDLHVHLNYSGDLVCSPADAARMQRGEGLHLLNLVAGNLTTSHVYDRELLEATAGTDLPWSASSNTGGDTVARMGIEYRNDLLGHVHALGPSAAPSRYYAGHERSDRPQDWPPNAVACAEMRDLGATVGYAHPAFTPFPEDGSTARFFENPRSVEARELVADAAIGLVDSIDLISPFDDEGAVFLYHRLLSCGLRLAATAGTDAFLSFAHGPGVASNPPGWGRVYAHLGDRALSVAAFQDAVRRGATTVTNGPWVTLGVDRGLDGVDGDDGGDDGHGDGGDGIGGGPGTVLDLAPGDRLELRAQVQGPGAEELTLVGPDGVIAAGDARSCLTVTVTVGAPTWIAAIARGPAHPATLDESVLAHTSPVYVDVDGRRVGRRADALWCLDLLDTLERFVAEHGLFDPASRDEHLGDLVAVLDQARSFYAGVADAAPESGS